MSSRIEYRGSKSGGPLFLYLDQTAQVADFIFSQEVFMIKNEFAD